MTRRAGLWGVAMALALAMLAAVIVVAIIWAAAPNQAVVVLARPVSPGTPLTAADVKLSGLPAKAVPADAARSVGQVVGKIMRYGGLPGDVVRAGALVTEQNQETILQARLDMAAEKNADLLGVGFPAGATRGLAAGLSAGERVNIYGMDRSSGQPALLVANAPILAIIGAGSSDQGSGGGTLMVGLTQAQLLQVMAVDSGSLVLAVVPTQGSPEKPPVPAGAAAESGASAGGSQP